MNQNQRGALEDLIDYAENATLEGDELPPCIKILQDYLDGPRLYMTACDAPGGGTDYIVVAARGRNEAVFVTFDDNPDRENIEVLEGTFLENLYEQYGGVAVLSTGM